MARTAQVTYEQVAAVANALYAQGVKDPGTPAIRAELARRAGPGAPVGSPNTIQRHLSEWRSKDRPVEVSEMPQLPAQLAAEISRTLVAAGAVAREKAEERVALLQGELEELASAGEATEARLEELQAEVTARTSERDSMAGQLAERTAEVVELKAALAAALEKGAGLERELHAAQAQAQAAEGRVDEIRQATDRQVAKMQADVDQARAGQSEAHHAAVEAEKAAVGALAHLDGERAAKTALEAQVAELAAVVKRLEGDAARAAAAEATANGLRDQVALLNRTVEMLRAMVPGSEKAAEGSAGGPEPAPKASKR